jgi:hypothetical protein
MMLSVPSGPTSRGSLGIRHEAAQRDDKQRSTITLTAPYGARKMVFNSPKRRLFAMVIAPVFFLPGTAHGDDSPVRTYFVGISVTDTIRYGSLAKLAKGQGHTLTWGRDMIPGAPLSWLWEHPKDGFHEEPFGLYPRTLSEHSWGYSRSSSLS